MATELNVDKEIEKSLDALAQESSVVHEVEVQERNNLTIDQLQDKIAQLAVTEDGAPLKTAMAQLKVALKQNPAACSLLLPQDIGDMVAALKKLTNKEIIEDLKPKARKKKEGTKLTQEEIDGLTDEDLGMGPEDLEAK